MKINSELHTVAADVLTGRQIRDMAGIPDSHDLWQVSPGATDVLVRDDAEVDLLLFAITRFISSPRMALREGVL